MISLQDIHISDKEFWRTLRNYWQTENYAAGIALLNNNQQLLTKYINANTLNETTDKIIELENNGINLKDNNFKTFYLPGKIEQNQIFFQISKDYAKIGVNISYIPTGQNFVTITYPSDQSFISMASFRDGEMVLVDVEVNLTNRSITFSTASVVDKPIWCVVYTMDSTLINPFSPYGTINMGGNSLDLTRVPDYILISAFALENNKLVLIDIFNVTEANSILFRTAENVNTALNCYVFGTETNILEDYVEIYSGVMSSSENIKQLNGQGYFVSSLTFDENAGMVLTNIILNYNTNNQAKVDFIVTDTHQRINCQLIHT